MAIFRLDREAKEADATVAHNQNRPLYNSDVPLGAIVSQIGGYKWYTDYFNVIKGDTGFESTFDASVDQAVVEYTKINNMLITLDTPIDNTVPEEITGSGYIDIDLIPKNGDVITAKLIDGRVALYTLTGIEKNNYNLKDIYKISFKLHDIVDNYDDDIYVKLNSKVANTYYYNKEYNNGSDKALFTKKEAEDNKTAYEHIDILIKLFNKNIITPDTKFTVSYRNKDNVLVHDPYLERFILSVVGLTELERRVTTYGLADPTKYTFLDLLIKECPAELVDTHFTEVASSNYGTNHMLKPIMYAGVSKVIELSKQSITITDTNDDITTLPVISSSSYILGEGFYGKITNNTLFNTVKLSNIESLVTKSINGDSIDFIKLVEISHFLHRETDKVKLYYYIPILIFLYRYYLRQYVINYV